MSLTERIGRLGAGATALLVFAWFSCTAWLRPLMLPDEGRYAGVAWEMLRSGEWLTPTLNGLPYFHKPPLFYWITAGSLSILGHHELAARMASILGATLGAMAMFVFVRRWSTDRTARATLLVLLAQPLWLIGGQFANLDMLVAGFITTTIILLAHAVLSLEQGQPYRPALAGAYAMAAAGVLAKGLIGFALPALVVFAWLLLQKRWRTLAALIWWPGILIFLALAGPWFVAMQLRFPDFLDYFFVVQHFQRFAAGGFNNAMPFWFFPVVLAVFFLPWLPWLTRSLASRSLDESPRGTVKLLMVIWAVVVVGFFSLPKSKLVGYSLPAIPPLAMLVADEFLSGANPSRRSTRWWSLAPVFGIALSLGAVAWLAARPAESMRNFGSVLGAQRHANEPVVMLDGYYFDLPFYARLGQPVEVVGQWDDPKIDERDSPRKEIKDAGRFAPDVALHRLTLPATLQASVCRSRTTWVIGPSSAKGRFPWLQTATEAHSEMGTTLWRVNTGSPATLSALRCD
jgi:4-amino-4-deoxy-L-arabinose transferase-like glycosyltransferase